MTIDEVLKDTGNSLTSKTPSAYGVDSANLSYQSKWEDDFDREYASVICDGAGIQDQSTREDIKDFIRYQLSQAEARGREEGAREVVKLIHKYPMESEADLIDLVAKKDSNLDKEGYDKLD